MEPATDDSPVVLDTDRRWREFDHFSGPGNPRNMFTLLWDDAEANALYVPPAIDLDGGTVGVYWHPSREWLFIGHEFCRSDCAGVVGAMTILNRNTGYSREISNCGGLSACIGWLPHTVDIDALPIGHANSVLPAPLSITYTNNSRYGGALLLNGYPYWLDCDRQTQQQNQVVNVATDTLEFTLPSAERCSAETFSQDVVFALSPNHAYYAITDTSRLTTLYAAEDGRIITRLNFFGEQLTFSDDSRFLTTISTTANAVWDVEQLMTTVP